MKKIKNKIKYKNGQKRNFKRENKKRKRNKRYHGLYDLEPNYYNDIGLLKHEDKLIARKTFPLDNFLNKNGIGESESPSKTFCIRKIPFFVF